MSKPSKGGIRAVNITKPVYSMATSDGQSAEIVMYGDIYEQQPTDWWGEPIEGQFITLEEFMGDLEQLAGCQEITVRMNSYGGDAGVSSTIHNRLRELSRDGAHLTCIVDGVAMSGGSLIMCACDTVKVNPSSLVMIHKCWTFLFGGYNADELRDQARQQDAWDKMQVEIYKRKCGLTDTVITHMMSETTYMTGREAVAKGFADELIEDAQPADIAASADGRCLFVNGRAMHLAPGMFAPDNIPTVKPEASATVMTNTQPDDTGKNEGGSTMTLEEFRAKNPEMAAQLEAEARAAVNNGGASTPTTDVATANTASDDAVQAERKRIQDIDALAGLFDAETINAAKYGDKACTAEEMTYRAAQSAAQKGKKFLAALDADAGESNTAEVGAADTTPKQNTSGDKTPEGRMAEARSLVKALFGKKEG